MGGKDLLPSEYPLYATMILRGQATLRVVTTPLAVVARLVMVSVDLRATLSEL